MGILIMVCPSSANQCSRGIRMEGRVPRKVILPEEDYIGCQASKVAQQVNALAM